WSTTEGQNELCARLRDTIVALVKESQPGRKVKKGQVVYGVVVGASMHKGERKTRKGQNRNKSGQNQKKKRGKARQYQSSVTLKKAKNRRKYKIQRTNDGNPKVILHSRKQQGLIVALVKESQPGRKVKKGQVVYGVVVGASMQKGRYNGSEVVGKKD
nr:ribosomal protein L14, bacterial-type [Tanacetum cinerariifolium]